MAGCISSSWLINYTLCYAAASPGSTPNILYWFCISSSLGKNVFFSCEFSHCLQQKLRNIRIPEKRKKNLTKFLHARRNLHYKPNHDPEFAWQSLTKLFTSSAPGTCVEPLLAASRQEESCPKQQHLFSREEMVLQKPLQVLSGVMVGPTWAQSHGRENGKSHSFEETTLTASLGEARQRH